MINLICSYLINPRISLLLCYMTSDLFTIGITFNLLQVHIFDKSDFLVTNLDFYKLRGIGDVVITLFELSEEHTVLV